ncbi:MAG: hypothetical protein BWY23_00530 [Spirochaetes bacterium ADurb.Bin218]|jgi:hypothetical protein|nr:MAG: hypothetical protein BWY23_00530 [Spirochaetes bacterium ADurb.Bin218]HOQ10996.1 hypothetical protein [Spirochaetota bacterium]HPX90587.1 hypothetical protein [Spirochaetota bacterium]
MAGFSLKDISTVDQNEENILKQVIAEAWVTMKRNNWDDTKFCTVNPSVVINYPVAKSFQSFFENEGWAVQIKKERRNYVFDVYRPQ